MRRLSYSILFGFALAILWPAVVMAQSVSVATPITDVTVTSTATLVKAADVYRYSLSCTNTDSSVHVRWGDSTVTTTKGQQLRATASIEILSRGAIYMISESTDVTVSCTEEAR